jgi:hypothetical protein
MKINTKNLKKQMTSKKSTDNKLTDKNKPTKEPTIQKHDVIFDILHLKKLLYGQNFMKDVPNYINKFFYKYGSKIFFDNGEKFECLTLEDAKRKIPDEYTRKFTITTGDKTKVKEIKLNTYFTNEMFLSTPDTKLTIDYKRDIKFKESKFIRGFQQEFNYLNMKKDLPRDYSRKVELTEFNKKGVEAFFKHLKMVICSNDDDEYDVVIKFLASSVVGHKVKISLMWNSLEQSGKGTVLNFMNDLLGDRMLKTSNAESVVKYTKDFEGCTLLNFDEMPKEGTYATLADKQKALITENEFDCRAMHQQPYVQKNTFNIITTSQNNVVSLTQTNFKRYYVNTISNDFIDKIDYFKELYKYLENEDVKVLIYQEFVKIFKEQVEPINWLGNNLKSTKKCQIKKMEALPKLHKYIKDTYLKNGFGLDIKTTDLLNDYKQIDRFATPNRLGSTLKEFGVSLKQFNTNSKTEKAYRKYIISFKDLRDYFSSKGWIDEEYDEIPDVGEGEDEEVEEVEEVKEQPKLSFKSLDEMIASTKKSKKKENNNPLDDGIDESKIICDTQNLPDVNDDELIQCSSDEEIEEEKPKKKLRRTKKTSKRKEKENVICKEESFDILDDYDIDNIL